MAKAKAERRKAKRDRNMKYQSKIDVSIADYSGKEECLLIKGKAYECEAAAIIDPSTFKPYIIVECEDGRCRRYSMEHFVDLQEARADKLNALGI